MTALMLACANKNKIINKRMIINNEAVALLLIEATQKAGALDVQVNVVWSVCWEGGWAGGGGRGEEGGRGAFAQGTDICVYVLQGKFQRSALHNAIMNGLESAVAKLLSLGADAVLKDEVRACSYMNTCMYSVDVCMFVNVLLIRISLSVMHIIQTYHVCM
jgi:hypothetical protein